MTLPYVIQPAPDTNEHLETSIEAPDQGVRQIDEQSRHQMIAEIAFSLWKKRGCPHGSPEEDWYQAERLVNGGSVE